MSDRVDSLSRHIPGDLIDSCPWDDFDWAVNSSCYEVYDQKLEDHFESRLTQCLMWDSSIETDPSKALLKDSPRVPERRDKLAASLRRMLMDELDDIIPIAGELCHEKTAAKPCILQDVPKRLSSSGSKILSNQECLSFSLGLSTQVLKHANPCRQSSIGKSTHPHSLVASDGNLISLLQSGSQFVDFFTPFKMSKSETVASVDKVEQATRKPESQGSVNDVALAGPKLYSGVANPTKGSGLGNLLHRICAHGTKGMSITTSLRLIQNILLVDPGALGRRGRVHTKHHVWEPRTNKSRSFMEPSSFQYPLFLALIRRETPRAVLQVLIQHSAQQRLLSLRDGPNDETALSLLLRKRPQDTALLNELLMANLPSVFVSDRRYNTVIHLACQYDAPYSSIANLAAIYPEALEKRNMNGKTPLDLSISRATVAENVIPLLMPRSHRFRHRSCLR